MASFTDVVKGQAVSLANQGFKKVAGNLRGVVGSSLNRGEPTNNPALKPRLDPKAFTFPLDVTNTDQGLGNHGHYILFFINECPVLYIMGRAAFFIIVSSNEREHLTS